MNKKDNKIIKMGFLVILVIAICVIPLVFLFKSLGKDINRTGIINYINEKQENLPTPISLMTNVVPNEKYIINSIIKEPKFYEEYNLDVTDQFKVETLKEQLNKLLTPNFVKIANIDKEKIIKDAKFKVYQTGDNKEVDVKSLTYEFKIDLNNQRMIYFKNKNKDSYNKWLTFNKSKAERDAINLHLLENLEMPNSYLPESETEKIYTIGKTFKNPEMRNNESYIVYIDNMNTKQRYKLNIDAKYIIHSLEATDINPNENNEIKISPTKAKELVSEYFNLNNIANLKANFKKIEPNYIFVNTENKEKIIPFKTKRNVIAVQLKQDEEIYAYIDATTGELVGGYSLTKK